jgi:hypothetical protein
VGPILGVHIQWQAIRAKLFVEQQSIRVVINTARHLQQLEVSVRKLLSLDKGAQTLHLIDILEYSLVGVGYKVAERWTSDVLERTIKIWQRTLRVCEDIFLKAILALDAISESRTALQIKGTLCSLHVRNEILILSEKHCWAIAEVIDVKACLYEALGARNKLVHQHPRYKRFAANDFVKHCTSQNTVCEPKNLT